LEALLEKLAALVLMMSRTPKTPLFTIFSIVVSRSVINFILGFAALMSAYRWGSGFFLVSFAIFIFFYTSYLKLFILFL